MTDSGKKSFYLYAWFRGKPKRFRIGGYPDITPSTRASWPRKCGAMSREIATRTPNARANV